MTRAIESWFVVASWYSMVPQKTRLEEANFRKSFLVERDAFNSIAQGQKNRWGKRAEASRDQEETVGWQF